MNYEIIIIYKKHFSKNSEIVYFANALDLSEYLGQRIVLIAEELDHIEFNLVP